MNRVLGQSFSQGSHDRLCFLAFAFRDGRDLIDRFLRLAQAGLDPLLLRERSIITPTSGLGNFGISQAERVMRLTGELSERVFNQVVGARLSIGA